MQHKRDFLLLGRGAKPPYIFRNIQRKAYVYTHNVALFCIDVSVY